MLQADGAAFSNMIIAPSQNLHRRQQSTASALQGGVLVALTSRTPTMSCIWSQVLSLPTHQVQFYFMPIVDRQGVCRMHIIIALQQIGSKLFTSHICVQRCCHHAHARHVVKIMIFTVQESTLYTIRSGACREWCMTSRQGRACVRF